MMDIIQQVLAICGGISIIGGALGIVYGAYLKLKEPHKNLDARLKTIEKDVAEIKQKLKDNDKQTEENREDMSLLMRSVLNLIENKLTGNNVEELKKTRDELLKALTE